MFGGLFGDSAGTAHSHDASALQAAVEALVSASQHQIAGVTQEAMEEDSSAGKDIFEGVTSQDAEGAAVALHLIELFGPFAGVDFQGLWQDYLSILLSLFFNFYPLGRYLFVVFSRVASCCIEDTVDWKTLKEV